MHGINKLARIHLTAGLMRPIRRRSKSIIHYEVFMKWYHFIACFFAGAFLANFVPHFVHGISGDSFPSPVSDPPGKGLSSPTVNIFWAMINLVIGYILLRVGKVSQENKWNLLALFIGVLSMSILLSIQFAGMVH
jgi:hypothetical protein